MLRYLQHVSVGLVASVSTAHVESPLISHVRWGDDSSNIERMLRKGYSPNVSDPSGFSALMWAACRGDICTVSILLAYGADVFHVDSLGDTALHCACGVPSRAMATFWTRYYPNEKGSGIPVPKDADYLSCIHRLAKQMEGNIDIANQSSLTPLMEAVSFPKHLSVLLMFSPDLDRRDSEGNTALDKARKWGLSESEGILADAAKRASR